MIFREWQQLSPEAAAREIHQRARTRLSPSQQRAAIAVLRSEAEIAAELAEAKSASASPLAGVPFFAKDLFDAAGLPTLAGSTFLPEVRRPAATDGFAVASVRKAGGVLVGKAHLHEFAYGITGENPHYGDVEHPRFPDRTTGGSSSGSVALVAAGVAPFALGTDTGGSVRVPAAFCGLYGFRLTPNDPWISDAFPLAPTFDTAGWFTATAEDLRVANTALVGSDAASREPRGCSLDLGGLDPEVASAFDRAAERFAPPADAATRDELRQGFTGALDSYHTTVAFEAWQAHQAWADRYRDRYDPIVWQRLIRGRTLEKHQLDSAAQVRSAIRATWKKFFEGYDFLVLPASPLPALTKPECNLENRNRVLTLTAPVSIGGLPVLSIPVPLRDGLTTGLQLVIPHARSAVVDWALRRCGQTVSS